MAGIYRLQGNPLVGLALERPVVLVDPLSSDAPVGLDEQITCPFCRRQKLIRLAEEHQESNRTITG